MFIFSLAVLLTFFAREDYLASLFHATTSILRTLPIRDTSNQKHFDSPNQGFLLTPYLCFCTSRMLSTAFVISVSALCELPGDLFISFAGVQA